MLVRAVCEAWASLAGPTSGIVEKVPSISLSDERLKQVAERYGVSTAQARDQGYENEVEGLGFPTTEPSIYPASLLQPPHDPL